VRTAQTLGYHHETQAIGRSRPHGLAHRPEKTSAYSLVQALQKTSPSFGVELRNVPAPGPPGPGDVVVAVGAVGVCGTDLHIYEWTAGYEAMKDAMPVTLGHEFAGTIAAVGPDARDLEPGMRVAVRPSVVCGHCPDCLADNADGCKQRKGMGVTRDGGLAAFVCVPAHNCVVVPAGMDMNIAALAEPMTVSAEAVDTGGVRPGQRVLVLGPGTIGQGAALFAREAGAAKVVIVGKNDKLRLETLRRLGFSETVDLGARTLKQALFDDLAEGGFDVVIEATGAPDVVQEAQQVLRKRGILVIAGIHPKPASVNLTRLVREHQQIRGTYRAPIATWSRVIDFLGRNAQLVRHMISHTVSLDRALDGFELLRDKAASKVLIVP